jgi:hypothetical protein
MKFVQIGRDAASNRFGNMQNLQAAGQRSFLPCLAGSHILETNV